MGHVIYTTTGTKHPTIARQTNQLDGIDGNDTPYRFHQ